MDSPVVINRKALIFNNGGYVTSFIDLGDEGIKILWEHGREDDASDIYNLEQSVMIEQWLHNKNELDKSIRMKRRYVKS